MFNKSVADVKPHFQKDLLKTLQSLYFAFATSNPNRHDRYFRVGFVNGLASVALQVGVNPQDFLSADDIELMRQWQKTGSV